MPATALALATLALAALALAALALAAPAEARQLSPANATFHVSMEGTYTAEVTLPTDECAQPMTGRATETGSFRSTTPARLHLAGPHGSIPLHPRDEPRLGRLAVTLQRASNLRGDGRPEGCYPDDPKPVSDCGARSVKPTFEPRFTNAGRRSSKTSIFGEFYVPDRFERCEVPGGFGGLDQKAQLRAIRRSRPSVARLFSGSSKIVERGSATLVGTNFERGSKVTYTFSVKITIRRSKLRRARFG